MKDLRIVFMGTPEFAVATLKALVDNGLNVVGVITAPDKPAGRGRKLKQSAVKEFALQHYLKVLQPTNLKSQEFLDALRSLNANLQIVVAFRMLPEVVWKMPELGTFNLHASLLPKYRGAAPINWAIINGETKTGVTTFFIDQQIDNGAILLQKEVEITRSQTAGELHDILMNVGSALVIDTVKLISECKARPVNQPKTDFVDAPKLNAENCRIHWDETPKKIHNLIRGLSPYPAAYTFLKNGIDEIETKITSAEPHFESHDHDTGKIVCSKKELRVYCRDGYLKILQIKLSGKKLMDAVSLMNGYQFREDAKMF